MANILVLDDVIDAGVLLKRILERKGHNVIVFSEEEEALKYIAKNKIDLAILDIKLKKMTGVEVLELIKEISTDIKVIMLTGYPTLETARASVKHGADEYCVKPIDKEELESKVAEVLGK
ncbi:response regulator [Desulfovibrio gilichinskyi]|uniref:Response regulator receiver domain-containing protein n=1 Tax=Desulfovibrio gilichinskyi TaxID=1519643 RepID=A0A1X7DYR7_9BACT|nr:response regulator [Desulfovibrio gilichinskyi]SMF23951.1 Response regulator receiver domain-containing protein [Desulfovibrio gilichinskyi]